MILTSRRLQVSALIALMILAGLCVSEAADPGYEIARACRANLNMLRDATEKRIQSGFTEFPTWAKMSDIRTMILTGRYLPAEIIPPTLDCEYFLVFKNPKTFDWYCNLHGLVGGDGSTTFRYHAYQFTAYTSSKYMNISKYKTHTDNIIGWASYEPTAVENFRYHYARNPMTTLLLTGLGIFTCLYILKSLFY